MSDKKGPSYMKQTASSKSTGKRLSKRRSTGNVAAAAGGGTKKKGTKVNKSPSAMLLGVPGEQPKRGRRKKKISSRKRAKSSGALKVPTEVEDDDDAADDDELPPQKFEQKARRMASMMGEVVRTRHRALTASHAGIEHMDKQRQVMAHDKLLVLTQEAADWVGGLVDKVYELGDDPREFLRKLDTGVDLCELIHRICPPSDPIRKACKYNRRAVSRTFLARDNLANYHKAADTMGVPPSIMFDSEDIVEHRHTRHVVLAILHLAKLANKLYNIPLPGIVAAELELDADEKVAEEVKRAPDDVDMSNQTDRELLGAVGNCGWQDEITIKRVAGKLNRYLLSNRDGSITCVVGIRIVQGRLLVRIGGGWELFPMFCSRKFGLEFNTSAMESSIKKSQGVTGTESKLATSKAKLSGKKKKKPGTLNPKKAKRTT